MSTGERAAKLEMEGKCNSKLVEGKATVRIGVSLRGGGKQASSAPQLVPETRQSRLG